MKVINDLYDENELIYKKNSEYIQGYKVNYCPEQNHRFMLLNP